MNWAKTIFISVVSLLVVGLFISIGLWIYTEIEFNKQNIVTPVKGKILFFSIYREEKKSCFLLEDGVIKPIARGLRIFFSDHKKTLSRDEDAFYVDDLTGKLLKEIPIPANYSPFDFDISPNGQTIVFTSKMGEKKVPYNLYTIDIEGKNLKKLTNFKTKGWAHIGNPKFSSDGKFIAFGAQKYEDDVNAPTSIYIIKSDGADQKELFGNSFIGGTEPAWSPDMKKLAFVSTIDGYRNLFTVDLFTLEVKQLTNFNAKNFGQVYTPCFSPDGSQICFVLAIRDVRAGSELFAVNADGTTLIRLTPAKRTTRYPYFATDQSPDWGE